MQGSEGTAVDGPDAAARRWLDSDPRLVERIRDAILAAPDRRITFAEFMRRALTEPGLGYYATDGHRPTRAGDFLTAPELHPFFGRCLGRFIEAVWERSGRPSHLPVREYGSGRGTLEMTVLAGLRADGAGAAAAIDWQGIDLPGRGKTATADPSGGIVIANEYLDALPVHRLTRQDGRLRELHVGWSDGWFREVAGALSDDGLAAPLEAAGIELVEGQRAEVRPAASEWMRTVCSGPPGSLVLVIDYGHEAAELYGARRMAGSLLTYRDHVAGDDPFVAVGRSDITAHVDLSELRRAAEGAGSRRVGSTSQARFLAELGLGELLAGLGREPATSMADYVAARAAVARLMDPRHLGAFRVEAWQRPHVEARGRPHAAAGSELRASRLPGFGVAREGS